MNDQLKAAYHNEIQKFRLAESKNNLIDSWNHIERAHILGQFYSFPHLETHWLMFLLAAKTFNFKEFMAQIPRLILAVPGSITGRAPKGNPGTGRIGIFTPTEVPEDLKKFL